MVDFNFGMVLIIFALLMMSVTPTLFLGFKKTIEDLWCKIILLIATFLTIGSLITNAVWIWFYR